MNRSLAALLLVLLSWALCTPVLHAAPAADPLLSSVPPQAVAVGVFDLSPDSESMKALVAAQAPEQRAVLSAAALLGLQHLITMLGGDADVEEDVLPWVTRRIALGLIPVPKRKDPVPVLLIETKGGTPAAALFGRLMQAGIKSKQLEQAPRAEDAPVWKAGKLAKGVFISYSAPVVILTWQHDHMIQAVRHIKGVAAGAQPAPAARAVAEAAPGLLRFAVAPHVFEQGRQQNQPFGLAGLSGAVAANPGGAVGEVVLAVKPEAGAWADLVSLRPTFSESIAGIPQSALAVAVAARPAVWFHALGLPIVDAVAAGMIGPPMLKSIGKGLAPVLSDVLGQEVALALVEADGKPSWLAVFTTARPAAFAGVMNALIQAGQAVEGLNFAAAPIGNVPGWTARVALGPKRPPTEIHLAIAEARLVVAGSRKALEASVDCLVRRAGSVATAEWYAKSMEALGPNPIAKSAVNTRGLAPALAALISGRTPLSPKYTERLADALLAGVREMGGGIRIDGNNVRAMGFMGLDYPKMAALGGIVLPAAAALAAIASADAKKAAGGAKADAQAGACSNQMKQLCMAAQLYAKDWGKLPRAEGWVEALEPYLKNKAILRCPAAAGQTAVTYAFNRALAELPVAQVENPARTILFYETASADPSPAGTGEDLPKPGRHGGRYVIGFADGHVEVVAEVDPAWWGK